jgi:2-phospho-L-lactate guanylyltransferase
VQVAVIIPVKSFTVAKGRLADTLTPNERAHLAASCASRVLAAAGELPVFVVTADDDIAEWATRLEAIVVRQKEPGLNAAVREGIAAAALVGFDHVVIAHSDLPLATSFAHIPIEGSITLVPDRRMDGTNVLSMPTDCTLQLQYGEGSFMKHLMAARDTGLHAHVAKDEALGLDLDTVDDLHELQSRLEHALEHEHDHNQPHSH